MPETFSAFGISRKSQKSDRKKCSTPWLQHCGWDAARHGGLLLTNTGILTARQRPSPLTKQPLNGDASALNSCIACQKAHGAAKLANAPTLYWWPPQASRGIRETQAPAIPPTCWLVLKSWDTKESSAPCQPRTWHQQATALQAPEPTRRRLLLQPAFRKHGNHLHASITWGKPLLCYQTIT